MAETKKPQVPVDSKEENAPVAPVQEEPAAAAASKKRPEHEPEQPILGQEDKDEKPAKHPKIVPGKAAEAHLKRLEDDGQYTPGDEVDQAAAKPIGLEIDQTFSQEIKAGVKSVEHTVGNLVHHHHKKENGAAPATEDATDSAHLAPGGVAGGAVKPEGLVAGGSVGGNVKGSAGATDAPAPAAN